MMEQNFISVHHLSAGLQSYNEYYYLQYSYPLIHAYMQHEENVSMKLLKKLD